MRLQCVFFSALLVIVSSAEHLDSPYVLHEKRHAYTGLQRGQRVSEESVIPFRIALKQSNLEQAYEYLINISHPASPHYGRLWSHDDVRNTFAPHQHSVDSVWNWLEASGIEDIAESESKGWLSFETTIAHAENLFRTQYHEHTESRSGAIRIGCDG